MKDKWPMALHVNSLGRERLFTKDYEKSSHDDSNDNFANNTWSKSSYTLKEKTL